MDEDNVVKDTETPWASRSQAFTNLGCGLKVSTKYNDCERPVVAGHSDQICFVRGFKVTLPGEVMLSEN